MSDAEKPDSRFLQANERTLLAWIRTSLGIVALGFVIARFRLLTELITRTPGPKDEWLEHIGIAVTVLAPLSIVVGVVRYARMHASIVRGEAPPTSAGPTIAISVLIGILLTAVSVDLMFRH